MEELFQQMMVIDFWKRFCMAVCTLASLHFSLSTFMMATLILKNKKKPLILDKRPFNLIVLTTREALVFAGESYIVLGIVTPTFAMLVIKCFQGTF